MVIMNCFRLMASRHTILIAVVGALSSPLAFGSTFTTLYQFTGGSDGSVPVSSVIEDAAGTLYGETYQAGDMNCVTSVGNPVFGCGTLYSFSRTAGLKALVEFTGPNGAYGYHTPTLIGSIIYGSALAGGSTDNGVLFSINTDGTGFTLLHQFTGTDGSEPNGSLVRGGDNSLYGVTSNGGPLYPAKTYGVLFKLTLDGTYTVLHSFGNGTDGGEPDAIVVEKSGIIIGSTFQGGNKRGSCGVTGCGVVFAYDPRSAKFTVLHTFTNGFNQGTQPILGGIGLDGTVYGNATPFFSIGPKTGFTLYPVTSGGDTIGSGLNIAPTLGPGQSLTSTEQQGPYSSAGTLYQQIGGALIVLHTFDGPDGADPQAPPLLTPSGSLIGTTGAGGAACSCGTIYEYTP